MSSVAAPDLDSPILSTPNGMTGGVHPAPVPGRPRGGTTEAV
jgi:hypothetical protein